LAAPSFLPLSLGTTQRVLGCGGWTIVKSAVTVVSPFKVTVQVPVPEQPPPDQPPNVEPEPAVAVSVTGVPAANACEQAEPQLMPAGMLLTLPEPLPDPLTLRVCVTGGIVPKVAVTV
jgi:hypothetical protein